MGCIKNNNNNNNNDYNDSLLLNEKYKYNHSQRCCQYQTEELEISGEEEKKIKELINKIYQDKDNPYKQILSICSKRPMKIIIDTDIGSDVDDAFALLLLSHLPSSDVECIGITTNYRPTLLRKHIAESILKQTTNTINDLSSIPVIAGNCYLCGTHRSFYYAGNEGKGLGINNKKLWRNINNENAEDFIYTNLCKYPQQITIISIGIPTNIGNLINKYGVNKISSLIGHIVVMGGGNIITQQFKQLNNKSFGTQFGNKRKHNLLNYNEPIFKLPNNINEAIKWIINYNSNTGNVIHLYPNHNLSGDSLASHMMFQLKCPISLISHHITSQFILRGKPIQILLSYALSQRCNVNKQIYVGNEKGICGVLLNEWFKIRKGQNFQCIHDVLTLYEGIYSKQSNKFKIGESCLKYFNGTFVCHQWAAFLTFIPNKNGPHRIALDCKDNKKWIKWCGDTLLL